MRRRELTLIVFDGPIIVNTKEMICTGATYMTAVIAGSEEPGVSTAGGNREVSWRDEF
jgi:hypothetical protein